VFVDTFINIPANFSAIAHNVPAVCDGFASLNKEMRNISMAGKLCRSAMAWEWSVPQLRWGAE
jgi:hypothetical protein